MLRVIVADDELHNRQTLERLLAEVGDVNVVAVCKDGFETVAAVQKENPDLLFLDINMPKLTGFDVLELLGASAPPVVFVTAYDEHALRAFDTSAIDYILKPVSAERIRKSISKYIATKSGRAADYEGFLQRRRETSPPLDRLLVKDSGHIHIVPVEKIQYIKAEDDYLCIVTENSQFVKQDRLSLLENSLDKTTFVRVHRSYIVNIRFILRLDPLGRETYEAVLQGGAKVPVSASGIKLLPWFNR
jgi:two-component system, LytTR family, response regulator